MENQYKPKNPKNRIDLLGNRRCPPHRFGEGKLLIKIGPPVTNEPCHFHKSILSQTLHHDPFCKLIKCPNYIYI